MDTTGVVPTVPNSDPVSIVPAYSTAMKAALDGRARGTLAPNVSNVVTTEAPMVNKTGKLVVLQARVKRTSTNSNALLTLPAGFRPTRQVFGLAIKDFTGSAGIQIDQVGAVITPFETSASEYMISIAYSTVEA